MKLETIHEIQLLPISIHQAWEFFSDPENLSEITPPALQLKLTSTTPEKMYPGMIITYRLNPFFAISSTWVTEITHVVEPHLFVDEQRFGPYRFWHHQHRFREIEGGVEMQDLVHYALPFGVLGRIAAGRLVRGELRKIFTHRREVLAQKFGTLQPSRDQ
ncbi:MAG: SRPBCC family protein [candidate division KSB1 bacterium]|nr:SRPBCC family protein [candidate division KSB1 bacterium]MDZ7305024.1 SRPBCC family protein [candidate division KSB1 bacterium]MDZ7314132.1 SRPBCC family protein [candidate division KSB1 bacterium]